ncbi:hypothetical protein F2Q69_00022146 [Brassica cretica]|uniref:Uncharacterized protein n=1 Tax=Brassica cretica TaxID=69181 RepID=A0A8S9Q8T0_BRACR|nr:hypothetical protein F2Q69_00022146 [Brassica cretica]
MNRALGATFPERHRQVALTCLIRATLPERRGKVDRVFIARRHENGPGATSRRDPSRSLPMSGATLQKRRGEVARVFIARRHENGPGATSRSDPSRSLPKPGATSRSDYWRSLSAYCLLEFMYWSTAWSSRRHLGVFGAQKRCKGDHWTSRALGETLPERHRQVALTCLIRATLSERRGEVARVFIARRHENGPGATPSSRSDLPNQSDLTRATRRSHSRFHRSETRKRARSDVSQRPLQVAPEAWSDLSERLLEVAAPLLFARIHVYSKAF